MQAPPRWSGPKRSSWRCSSARGQSAESRGHGIVNGLRSNDNRICSFDSAESRVVEVVAVTVGDQNQVRARKPLIGRRSTDRIAVNRFPFPTHDEAGVVDRMNNDLAIIVGQMIAGHDDAST